eukprot:gene732-694_t
MSILSPDELRVVYLGLRRLASGHDKLSTDQLTAYIRLLFKGNDPLMLEFWRALVIQSTEYKAVEFFHQVPLEAHLEGWISHFLPGVIAGFRKHFGTRVAVDKVHARADLARMMSRPTCFMDADAERAFPSIDRALVMLGMLAMGMSLEFVKAQARLWGIVEFDVDTGKVLTDPDLEPRGLLAIPGTNYPTVKWERGAMEGTRLGPQHWQVLACIFVCCLRNELRERLRSILLVADDIKLEHAPSDAQAVATATVMVLALLNLVAAGHKWEL